jgi:cobalt-zinc-cadmium efflux system membrane fusion protein
MNRTTNVLILLLAAALAAGCNDGGHGHADEARKVAAKDEHADEDLVKLSADEIKRAGIRTEGAEEKELAEEVVFTATVHPNQDALAHVAPRVSARIVAVYANLGDRVRAGQALALLDSLEVGDANSAYRQATSEFKLAAAALQRAEKLHAEEVIPAKDYQRIRAEHEKARAQLAGAEDRLRMLGVAPNAERAVSTFAVTAPIGGTVLEKHAVLGEQAKTDGSMFTVGDLGRVWIEANVNEKDLAKVRAGAAARVTVAAYAEPFAGKVTYVGAMLDKATRTVPARVEVANADGRLKPEMFATVAIQSGRHSKALVLPESAVTLLQGLPTVFVEEGAGFEARPVELGERANGAVAVKSGIKPGELVAVEGVYALKARALKKTIGAGHVH